MSLGFSLADVQRIVNSSENNFDRTKTLIRQLIKPFHIWWRTQTRNKELFVGFDPEKQKEYETYLVNRLGEDSAS